MTTHESDHIFLTTTESSSAERQPRGHFSTRLEDFFDHDLGAYLRALLIMVVALVLWLYIGASAFVDASVAAVAVGHAFSVASLYEQISLAQGLGIVALVFMLLPWLLYRAARGNERERQARAKYLARDVWDELARTYGADYRDWVAATTDNTDTANHVEAYAETMHGPWRTSRKDAIARSEASARRLAARAVVANGLGCAVTHLSIHPDQPSHGRTAFQSPSTVWLKTDNDFISMSIALAGHTVDIDDLHASGAAEDTAKALESADAIVSGAIQPCRYDGPLTVEALIDEARARASAILTDKADVVTALTADLLTYRTLDVHHLRTHLHPDRAKA